MASIPFFIAPVSVATRFDPQCFRVLLLRRLWCHLPLSSATCRCGQPLDSRGHHRGACAHAGVLGSVGFLWRVALPETAEKQVLVSPKMSGCRIWTSCLCLGWTTVAWKWPPTFLWSSVGVDTTVVSVVWADGVPRRQCARRDGAALDQARRTQNSLVTKVGPIWWCAIVRQAGGGPRKPIWWGRERAGSQKFVRPPVEHGFADGALHSRAALLRRSCCHTALGQFWCFTGWCLLVPVGACGFWPTLAKPTLADPTSTCVCVSAGALTRQPKNSKRAHLSAPALQTPPKFHEKTSQREKKEWNFRREREKKERNFGRSRGRAVRWTHPPHTQTTTTTTTNNQAPTSTDKHHQAPPRTTSRHQQAPAGTSRHQQAPTGTNRHQQATTRNNQEQQQRQQQQQKIWPKH